MLSNMGEFAPAVSPEIQLQRSQEYAPIDWDAAEILSGHIDYIIDLEGGCRSIATTSDKFSEWYEATTLLSDTNRDIAYMWPLTQLGLSVRRTNERDPVNGGETYTTVLEWQVHNDALVDAGIVRSYVLMKPHDQMADEPKLVWCQQQSNFAGKAAFGPEVTIDTIDSEFHTVDKLLNRNFICWQKGYQYDAEQFLNELTMFSDMLTASRKQ